MYVVTRSSLPFANIVSAMRSVVSAIDPNLPLYEPRMLDERIGASLAPRRLAMIVLTGLGALSLGLAVFGLYGVISYAASQRTTEFGIRMALGAQPSDVRSMVIRQGVLLALTGVAFGVAVAFVATQALAGLLFGVSSHDPLTFVGAPLVLAAIAVFASYLPARRATRISPLDALRGG
jgi:putative ABC transport system permease protein